MHLTHLSAVASPDLERWGGGTDAVTTDDVMAITLVAGIIVFKI